MVSDRIRRRIETLLDEADAAVSRQDWSAVEGAARAVLAIDDANDDAAAYLKMAAANLGTFGAAETGTTPPTSASAEQPQSFAGGRYEVRRFLGEGGKKKVYLAHDALLDRDVAFALIKTDGLDDTGRERVTREAQAMGRMGAHPHLVSVFDLGEEDGAPYIVTELMRGGDVEGELERAGGPLEVPRVLELAKGVARGLVFAHERGVVHRDLKPGNVWLTAEGVPKIGDFGLAVAEGRTRLTQHGMMVGTFAYMPPEQALGAEVTPRSDLYSLGAMLYELITGKPPFEADDPTAVISQHLNAEPVAPSWRTDRCPPALEDLILALLAKDPATRPASAADVLAALEAIDPSAKPRSHSIDSVNPLERLSRGVFVGRERELERLRAALDDALAGRGSVVMLVGEPGIGKTRTAQELETYARLRGAEVLWGRAHEAAGMPAYWPWLQVGRAWGVGRDLPALAAQGIAFDPELQRLFPELRRVLPGLPELGDAEADASAQFRLFDAYTQFVRAQSAEQPWLVVLDDLHWADKPTLQLLAYAARELATMRVLVVGTYRDTELARTHPLSETLAELNRGDGFTRINLGGLTRDDVADYIRNAAGIEPPREHVDRIFEETEGNAFFLTEVVNLLTQEGTLTRTSLSGVQIPEGVREALGRRLDRLSEDANALFQYAAIAGRQFAYDTLHLVSGHDDDTLLRLIEEGLGARVIEDADQPGRYRFTHALMQETLLDEVSMTRQVQLHGRVAEALERRWGDRADEHASRLAQHYAESATLTPGHTTKAVRYLALAAREADAGYAWAEAARLYARAVELIDDAVDVSFGEDEAELLTALGRAAIADAQFRPGIDALNRALDLYRSRQDGVGFARAAVEMGVTLGMGSAMRLATVLEEALDMLGAADEVLEAELIALVSDSDIPSLVSGEVTRARLARARESAERRSLGDVTARLLGSEATTGMQRGEFEQSAVLWRRAYETPGVRPAFAWFARLFEADNVLLGGGVSLGVALLESALQEPNVKRSRVAQHTLGGTLALVRLGRGDIAGVDDLDGEFGRPDSHLWWAVRAHLALIDGRREDCQDALARLDAVARSNVGHLALAVQTQLYWELGDLELATRAFVRWRQHWAGLGLRGLAAGADLRIENLANRLGPLPVTWLGRAARQLADEVEREALRVIVRQQPGMFAARVDAVANLKRVYGDWALALDMPEDAERLYRDAFAWCEREGWPIEAGRCHQGLAELAERRGEREQAMQHLDAASQLFSKHGAKFFLDQVLAKKEILKA